MGSLSWYRLLIDLSLHYSNRLKKLKAEKEMRILNIKENYAFSLHKELFDNDKKLGQLSITENYYKDKLSEIERLQIILKNSNKTQEEKKQMCIDKLYTR